jgi:hypothetical protein
LLVAQVLFRALWAPDKGMFADSMSVPYVGVATTIGPTHMDKLRTMLEEARRAGVRHMQRW